MASLLDSRRYMRSGTVSSFREAQGAGLFSGKYRSATTNSVFRWLDASSGVAGSSRWPGAAVLASPGRPMQPVYNGFRTPPAFPAGVLESRHIATACTLVRFPSPYGPSRCVLAAWWVFPGAPPPPTGHGAGGPPVPLPRRTCAPRGLPLLRCVPQTSGCVAPATQFCNP